MQENEKEQLLRLYEGFLESYQERTKRVPKDESSRGNQAENDVIFDLIKMSGNNRSKVFSLSASFIDPSTKDSLLEQGLIQSIFSETEEKYALSLLGIARCINVKANIPLDQQFASFLKKADKEYNKSEPPQLDWREKLATLSLILLASTSETSSIQLTNTQNQAVLMEVFQEVLFCLKKYHLVEEKAELRASSRGENPVAGHMARLDLLPRKTSHYYIGKDYVYYFSIANDQGIDASKLSLLMKRCFEGYDMSCTYSEMYKELSRISQKYSTRFLGRNVNPNTVLNILSQLKAFLDNEIYHLKPS